MNTLNDALKPCPFCGAAVTIIPVGRDWWRLGGDHDENCMLNEYGMDVPQTDDQHEALIRDWNYRATTPESSAAQGAMGDERQPVEFKTLLNGQRFQFLIDGPVFVRDKSFWKTTPDHSDDARSFPARMRDLVYVVAQPSDATAQPITDEQIIEIANANGIPIRTGKTAIKFARALLANTAQGKPDQGYANEMVKIYMSESWPEPAYGYVDFQSHFSGMQLIKYAEGAVKVALAAKKG